MSYQQQIVGATFYWRAVYIFTGSNKPQRMTVWPRPLTF